MVECLPSILKGWAESLVLRGLEEAFDTGAGPLGSDTNCSTFIFFLGAGDRIQGLPHAGQALYY
jgi:hypothetical protein